MGFLSGKQFLITGLISNKSIAYGIATAMAREGAQLAFTYQVEKLKDRVGSLASEFNSDILIPCDVTSDQEIEDTFNKLREHWDGLDGIIHSIAYAPADQLAGDYLDVLSREGFQTAHDVSSYSFAALVKAGLPMMEGRNAAVLTLSYLGALRAVPNYNVMGIAKASLEANMRYLSASLGHRGIRANAISAGPIKTLAASGIKKFKKMLSYNAGNSPLKRNVTIEEVGNAAAFLCSDLASGITGDILYVDAGYNIGSMLGMEEES